MLISIIFNIIFFHLDLKILWFILIWKFVSGDIKFIIWINYFDLLYFHIIRLESGIPVIFIIYIRRFFLLIMLYWYWSLVLHFIIISIASLFIILGTYFNFSIRSFIIDILLEFCYIFGCIISAFMIFFDLEIVVN